MIRLGLLGTPTVQRSSGGLVDGLMSQPKRLAVLAYLAVQGPEAEARARILPLFWPESDTAHARLSLRQAIHFIRAATRAPDEPDILVASKGGRIGLNDRVWCDAVQFDSRISAGDYVGALALYRGDFLQGVRVQGAPAFEHWVERERTRLRRAAEMASLLGSKLDQERSGVVAQEGSSLRIL